MHHPTLWLYLHFPALQLDRIYLDDTHQDSPANEKALILVHGARHQVIQCNQNAIEQGVRIGMGLGSAASLCQDLNVQAYLPDIEKQALLEIAQWLYIYTADISLCGTNGILLRVTNMLTLYDNVDNYWRTLQQHLEQLRLRYQFAYAYSPLSAELLAKSGSNLFSDQPEQILKALYKQALRHSRLTDKQIEKLQRVGIRSMKQLIETPMPELAKRFDLELVTYVGRLTGSLPHPISFYHPPKQFSRDLELLFEISNLDHLDKPLYKLLQQLEKFLCIQDHYAYELELSLNLRSQAHQRVCVTSAKGDYQADAWLRLFRLRFESVKIKSPVLSINLKALRTMAKHEESADLFSGKQGNTTPLELISKLQAKLGKQAIQGLSITNDPRPEYSSAIHKKAESNATLSLASPHIHPNPNKLRPSILLPKPEYLRERITLIEGPERIATGWWDEHPVIRDYFIARSHRGTWLWVFKTPEQNWYLHGVFS